MSQNTVLDKFAPSMDQIDAMIKQLETNLGKKQSLSPFVALKKKYSGAPQEAPKEEAKAAAPVAAAAETKGAAGGAPAAAAGGQQKKEKKIKQPKGGAKPAEPESTLSPELEWFNSSDIRVGRIVECIECPESEKLMDEKIDIGDGEIRWIGSGVRPLIPLEEMKRDALVMVFTNLKAKKLGPIMSHGMVMCSSTETKDQLVLVRPPAGSKIGERVMLEGNLIPDFSQEKQPELKSKKKVLENYLTLSKSNAAGEACFNGIRMITSAGVIQASLKDCRIS